MYGVGSPYITRFRSDLSITRKTDGNFGNVSAFVLFFKVAYPVNENSGNSIAGISIQATLTVYLDVDVNDREDTINNYKARKKTKPPHNCGRTVRIETFLNEVLENVKAGN